MVPGVAASARVGTLAADRVAREVGDAVGAAPDEVLIRVGEPAPASVRLELWCADPGWCESTAELLGAECLPGFVRLSLRRGPLRPA